jgi:hypothetical protein
VCVVIALGGGGGGGPDFKGAEEAARAFPPTRVRADARVSTGKPRPIAVSDSKSTNTITPQKRVKSPLSYVRSVRGVAGGGYNQYKNIVYWARGSQAEVYIFFRKAFKSQS